MRNIKPFSIEDVEVASDKYLDSTRINLIKLIIDDMRDDGYVPVLDLEPNISVEYKQAKDTYIMAVTVYGVFVGRKKCLTVEGMSGNRLLPKSTPKNK